MMKSVRSSVLPKTLGKALLFGRRNREHSHLLDWLLLFIEACQGNS